MCDVQPTRQRRGVEQTPTASSTLLLAYADKNPKYHHVTKFLMPQNASLGRLWRYIIAKSWNSSQLCFSWSHLLPRPKLCKKSSRWGPQIRTRNRNPDNDPGRPKKNGGQSERGWRQWSEERRLGWCCHLKQIVAVEVPCHEVAHGILSLSWCRNECANLWQSQNTFGVSTEGNLVWVALCNNGPFSDTQGDPPERN